MTTTPGEIFRAVVGPRCASRRCHVCRRRIGDSAIAIGEIRSAGVFLIHDACDGNPSNLEVAHEERQSRRERGL